jgi:hypothetical protein
VHTPPDKRRPTRGDCHMTRQTRCTARHPVHAHQVRCELPAGHDGQHGHSFYARYWDAPEAGRYARPDVSRETVSPFVQRALAGELPASDRTAGR